MDKFNSIEGGVLPLDRANIDTDQIIPKQYLLSIEKTGFGNYLFDEWRFLDHGKLGMKPEDRSANPDFILNQPAYRQVQILLARRNFGCGSSREHAVWALMDYGFRVIIAPSYSDIFFSNALKNGLLAVALSEEDVEALFQCSHPQGKLRVDLAAQSITTSGDSGIQFQFDIAAEYKHRLQNGLDDIDIILRDTDAIGQYERRRREREPWIYGDV